MCRRRSRCLMRCCRWRPRIVSLWPPLRWPIGAPQLPPINKIKKDGSGLAPSIAMTENPDILAAVAALPQGPYCVGFAAESQDLVQHGRAKLIRKGVPLIVGNIGPATFGRDDNALLLIDAEGEREIPHNDKLTLARELVRDIAERLQHPQQPLHTQRP